MNVALSFIGLVVLVALLAAGVNSVYNRFIKKEKGNATATDE